MFNLSEIKAPVQIFNNKKIGLIKALHSHSAIMERGIYVLNGKFVHKFSSSLPEHLIKSKGSRLKNIPTYYVHKESNGYNVILDVSGDGLLFFDTKSNKTLRAREKSVYTEEYCNLRNKFSQEINSPRYEIKNDQKWQIEEMLEGQIVQHLPEQLQIEIRNRLVDSLLNLARRKNGGYTIKTFDDYIKNLNDVCRGLIYNSDLNVSTLKLIIESSIKMPSHGDLELQNVIMQKSDIYVIDWDPDTVSVRPFWYDIISLHNVRSSNGLNDTLLKNLRLLCLKEFSEGYIDGSFSEIKKNNEQLGGYLLVAWYICFLSDKRRINQKYLHRLKKIILLMKELQK